MPMPNGRPTSERTIRRQVRQVLGSHVPQLAEKALAKGLQGGFLARRLQLGGSGFGLGQQWLKGLDVCVQHGVLASFLRG